MAFYIESRFVDIRTLVDFSEFDEADFNLPSTTDTPTKPTNNDASSLPIQSQETLDNSQALEQVTKIIIESENQSNNSPVILESELKNEITTPISADEPVLVAVQIKDEISSVESFTESALPAPKVEIVDKTSLFAKYINQKYEKEMAAEFIKILLNPFIVILAYRYEFLDSFDSNSFSINLRHLKNVADAKTPNFNEDSEISNEQRFQTNFLEYNRKKELERKMQRK